MRITILIIHVAYITDPIKYINLLTSSSSFIALGIDTGHHLTKLGITYLNQQKKSKFAALLVYDKNDAYEKLLQFYQPQTIIQYQGDSSHYQTIFQIFQHIIHQQQTRTFHVLLNSDMKLTNTVTQTSASSSYYPCPICIVHKDNLLSKAELRSENNTMMNDVSTIDQNHIKLIQIDADHIVPLPLHIFLGISNKIIKCMIELLGNDYVMKGMKKIKTIHTTGHGGLSDLYELNGQEISKFIKKNIYFQIIHSIPLLQQNESNILRCNIMYYWLVDLHHYLLYNLEWNREELNTFKIVIDDIWENWNIVTNRNPTPKLHLLCHAYEFAKRFKLLSQCSEAHMEAYHHTNDKKYQNNHFNQSHNTSERLRRTLADCSVESVITNTKTNK